MMISARFSMTSQCWSLWFIAKQTLQKLRHYALHCTALHCTALHCTALHCTAQTQALASTKDLPTNKLPRLLFRTHTHMYMYVKKIQEMQDMTCWGYRIENGYLIQSSRNKPYGRELFLFELMVFVSRIVRLAWTVAWSVSFIHDQKSEIIVYKTLPFCPKTRPNNWMSSWATYPTRFQACLYKFIFLDWEDYYTCWKSLLHLRKTFL